MEESLLYETLLRKGVDDDYIKLMKQTHNISDEPYKYYYDEIRNENKKVETIVPVSKIKSLGARGTNNLSWFDHACCHGTDNIDFGRCERAFKHLQKQPLADFHNYYDCHPVPLKYYEEDDFYVVYGDGTHRTLWAKITDAQYIKAYVTHAKKSNIRYEAYRNYKKIEADFNEYLSNLDLQINGYDYYNYYDSISEIHYKHKYLLCYSLLSPEIFKNQRTLNQETVGKLYEQQENFKDWIRIIVKQRDRFHLLMKFTPVKWRPKFFSFLEKLLTISVTTNAESEKLMESRKLGFRMLSIDYGYVNNN